jgi:hypothetical protein
MIGVIRLFCAALLVSVAAAGCGRQDEAPAMRALQNVKAGDMDVVLLAPADALPQGKATFVLEFRGPDGALRDVGIVKANATMPMAGMPPMFGNLELQPAGTPGRYQVAGDFSMAGTWQINVEWQGPAGMGSTILRGTVR